MSKKEKKDRSDRRERRERREKDKITLEEINNYQDNEINKFKPNYDFYLEKSYHYIVYFSNFTYKTICFFIKVSGIYLLWILLHFTASHLYINLCVPKTIVGFLMSPFMTATPHCQGLRWVVYNAANMINNMWIMFGAWICSTILIINKEGRNDNR